MGPLSAFRRGIALLRDNPVTLAAALAVTVVMSLSIVAQYVHPLLLWPATAVSYLFLPFLVGGFVGMVHEGIGGAVRLDTFFAAGKDNYLTILLGGIIVFALTFVAYLGVIVVGIAVGIGIVAAGVGGLGVPSLVPIAIAVLFGTVVVLAPLFLLQFYPAAVVVEDARTVESLKRSVRLVTGNFGSVLGFDVVAVLVSLVAQIPQGYLFFVAIDDLEALSTVGSSVFQLLSPTELAVYLVISIATGTVFAAVNYAYYVVYFEGLRDGGTAVA